MMDRLFRLTWRRLLLILLAWVAAVVLHNLVYAMFRDAFGPDGDEPFFFVLATIVIPAYFLVSLVYTTGSFIVHWLGRTASPHR